MSKEEGKLTLIQFVLCGIILLCVFLNTFTAGALLEKFMKGLLRENLEEKGAVIWLVDKWASIFLFNHLVGKELEGIKDKKKS